MTFRRYARKPSKRLKAFGRGRSPEELKIYTGRYIARTQRGKAFSKTYKALAIAPWLRFTMLKLGEPFIYHGTVTKRYSAPKMRKLFNISHDALWRMVKSGVLPEPMVRVKGDRTGERVYWLYHQVQPVYTWVMHMRARGIVKFNAPKYKEERAILHRQLRRAEKRFLKLAGHPINEDYEAMVGRYGVLWINDKEGV